MLGKNSANGILCQWSMQLGLCASSPRPRRGEAMVNNKRCCWQTILCPELKICGAKTARTLGRKM